MQQTSLDRRTLAKGAAWAAPALTLAAAAPIFAGSACSDCVIPVLSASATTLTLGSSGFPLFIPNPTGTVSMASAFTFNVTGCTGLISAALVTISSAVLTMNDGNTYTSGAIGVGLGAVGQIATAGGVSWSGVALEAGPYAGIAGIGSVPSYPTAITFNMSYPITIGGVPTTCSTAVTFTPTFLSAVLGTLPGAVVLATSWL